MHKVVFVAKSLAILLMVFLLSGITPSYAGGQGKYTGLYFTSPDGKTCGGWYVTAASQYDASTWVLFTRPGIVTFKLTDATGKVVTQGTQDTFNGVPETPGSNTTLVGFSRPAYGMPDATNANWKGAKNPIHAVVSVDSDLIADVTADNPCLPGGAAGNNPPPSQPSACSLKTSYNGLRARSEPSAKAAVVGALASGTAYPVLAKGRDNAGAAWWQVNIAGVGSGWVLGSYVKTSGDCSGVPTGGAAPQTQPGQPGQPASGTTQSTACTVRTGTDGLRLRSGPAADYQLVGQMSIGTDYPVLGQNRDAKGARWWQINAGSLGQAWVNSSFVATHGNCSGVPTVAAPPKA